MDSITLESAKWPILSFMLVSVVCGLILFLFLRYSDQQPWILKELTFVVYLVSSESKYLKLNFET